MIRKLIARGSVLGVPDQILGAGWGTYRPNYVDDRVLVTVLVNTHTAFNPRLFDPVTRWPNSLLQFLKIRFGYLALGSTVRIADGDIKRNAESSRSCSFIEAGIRIADFQRG